MTTAIILLILFLLFLLWPRIMRALRPVIHRWMARRMENFIRKAAGMPQIEQRHNERQNARHAYRTYGKGEPIIPKEYAEDVEFTETVRYSSDKDVASDGTRRASERTSAETQVSDAEWEEIR